MVGNSSGSPTGRTRADLFERGCAARENARKKSSRKKGSQGGEGLHSFRERLNAPRYETQTCGERSTPTASMPKETLRGSQEPFDLRRPFPVRTLPRGHPLHTARTSERLASSDVQS